MTHRAIRPLPFVHPTRAVFTTHPSGTSSSASLVKARWSARASRKNRYVPTLLALEPHPSLVLAPRLHHAHTHLKLHLTWDLSFWLALVFVVGSAMWVINGFVLFLPLLNAAPHHANAAAWCAFAGGALFEGGSYLMIIEALNTGHEQLFGPALWELVGYDTKSDGLGKDVHFRWYGLGSWRELGFLVGFIQMLAATIFWISTITGLPTVIPNLAADPPVAITDALFWTPQVIGGTGFIASALLLMLEVQRRWWLPNLKSLGWHIGLWNLVGAVGFTLCGALGYGAAASSKANYQSVLATFWGSWAFLIGSTVQLLEALWREEPAEKGTSVSGTRGEPGASVSAGKRAPLRAQETAGVLGAEKEVPTSMR